MTVTKVAGVALGSLFGVVLVSALASTSASAQGYGGPGPGPDGGWWAWHNGLTFEASVGLGYLYAGGDSQASLAGFNLAIGGFINPQLAITLREASNTFSEGFGDGSSVTITTAVIGPHLQYWLTPQLWLGGGAGFATTQAFFGDGNGNTGFASASGFGLDLRGGVTFGQRWRRTWNLSLEVTPEFYSGNTVTGVSVELGYQFL